MDRALKILVIAPVYPCAMIQSDQSCVFLLSSYIEH